MSELKMPDINTILIAGTVTGEPTLRRTPAGTAVTNFYIASNRKYRDNAGIWRESVCHVGVVAWQKLAEIAHEMLKPGSVVLVDGELQSRSWKTEEGNNKSVVEIRARRIQFLENSGSRDLGEEAAPAGEEKQQPLQPEIKAQEASGRQIVGPTEFDFGYQDLKI